MALFKKLLAFRDPRRAARESMHRQAIERTRLDPLQSAKAGSRELVRIVTEQLQSRGDTRPESLLCALGALAGFACQVSVRTNAYAHGMPQRDHMAEDLSLLLFGMEYSVWGLVAGAARHHGCINLPEPAEIWAHVGKSMGTPEFGIPRIPGQHMARDLPADYLRLFWPMLKPVITRYCSNPAHWPIMCSLALQQAIEVGQGRIDAEMAMRMALESALPMARIHADFS
ncbi:hypothetical protein [Pseudoduganella sp. OTU4001]|uniref:hypothetical protein n=1 Tax=Pseudoduganella sp. OTU4001 TaxID=3043854 RepID=UPI00313B0683